MDGIFNVLKPPGMTSHDVIGFLRRALQTKKIGHGGTLDPDAAGVLPVFAGTATRLLEFAVEGRKQYIAEFTLGQQTDTGDDSGRVIKELPVPQLTQAGLEALLARFTGPQLQLPPMYSALKVNGHKLYELARRGVEVERRPRPIEIYKLELLHFTPASFTVAVECSKGTYIRVLGEDMAAALGTCGTMSFLLRTQVGAYTLNQSHTLQEIAADPEGCAAAPVTAVAHLPRLPLSARQAARITNGVRTTMAGVAAGQYVLLGPAEEFLGIGRCLEGRVQAEKIFAHYKMPEDC
ncbi:MAG: tRNA pseudouridine(55) synthase TruB [Phascolarctobacterium sp.]|uniref:tRNA pseudouridine(55) synthase TruB n=1 Tax=Phascolarctobacterium sp. TaxID=2049039 RepID=UPI0026DD3A22|nr:tRNA pseudouridine(55) synthase TruB [Phascolarctobacterium sp.]MDO4921566.1 tRNA pseudouridine(55) synthase TruB [Phascolarctobacterium sp.]